LDLSFHAGKGKIDNSDQSFTKFVFNSSFKYYISPKWVFDFELDGQLAPQRLPITESFHQRNSYGGRGMLYMNFDAQSAIAAVPQISYLQSVKHPLVFMLRPYAYYEYAIGSSYPQDNKDSANFRNDALGAGIDIFLVDNIVLNLEYNRKVGPDEKIIKKKSNVFAGLIYNFSFNTFG
jgi:hemolysin activation/secretion protein